MDFLRRALLLGGLASVLNALRLPPQLPRGSAARGRTAALAVPPETPLDAVAGEGEGLRPGTRAARAAGAAVQGVKNLPKRLPKNDKPPRKVALLVEPTPFTHVSGPLFPRPFRERLKVPARVDFAPSSS